MILPMFQYKFALLMNSFIVIFIIIRSWLKSIKYDLTKFIFCILGLLISIYVYGIYNSVVEQNVSINTIGIGNCINHVDYYVPLSGFFDNDNKNSAIKICDEQLDTLIRTNEVYSITYISNNIDRSKNLFDSIPYYLQKKLPKDYFFNIYVKTDLKYSFINNNWLSLHRRNNDGYGHRHFVADSLDHARYYSDNFYHTIKGTHNHKYLSFDKDVTYINGEHIYVDTLMLPNHIYVTSFPIDHKYSNDWYDSHDISKFKVTFTTETENIGIIKFSYTDENVYNVFPNPDEWGNDYFTFNSKQKIEDICKNGLQMSVNHPDKEPVQSARNFILSAFITLFLTLCCTFSFAIVQSKIKARSKRVQLIKQLLQRNKERYAAKIFRPILLQNLCFSIILGLLSYLIIKDYLHYYFISIIVILVHVTLSSAIYYRNFIKSESIFLLLEKNRVYASITIASLALIVFVKSLPIYLNGTILYLCVNILAISIILAVYIYYVVKQIKKLYHIYKTGTQFFNKKGKIKIVRTLFYFIILIVLSIILFAFLASTEDYNISACINYVILVVAIFSIYIDVYTYRRRIA